MPQLYRGPGKAIGPALVARSSQCGDPTADQPPQSHQQLVRSVARDMDLGVAGDMFLGRRERGRRYLMGCRRPVVSVTSRSGGKIYFQWYGGFGVLGNGNLVLEME